MSGVITIPLEQIVPNPDQPRRYISPESIQALADSLKEIGQQTPIKLRPLTGEEQANFTTVQYMLIGGHRRFEAAKLAGLTSLEAIVLTLTPEQADLAGFMDNQSEEMTWLDTDLAIARRVKATGLTQRQVAIQLGVSQAKVYNAVKVAGVLNQASIALLDQQLVNENKGFMPTERLLLALTGLDSPEAVEQALRVVIDKEMSESQAKALVASMQTGTPAEAHVPVAKASKAPKVTAPLPAVPEEVNQQPHSTPAPANNSTMGVGSMLGWDLLAGISVATQIRAKIKKGEKPTLAETLILLADLIWRVLHWLSKVGWKVAKWLTKGLWKLLKTSVKDIFRIFAPAVRKIVSFVFGLALLIGLVWLVWDIHEHGVMHPVRLAESKIFPPTPVPTPIPTAVPTAVLVMASPTAVPTLEPTPIPTEVITKHKKAKVAAVVPTAVPTVSVVQMTPTPQKKDDVLGDVAKGANAVGSAAKLFGL